MQPETNEEAYARMLVLLSRSRFRSPPQLAGQVVSPPQNAAITASFRRPGGHLFAAASGGAASA